MSNEKYLEWDWYCMAAYVITWTHPKEAIDRLIKSEDRIINEL